jgi:hypothetical protein
MSIAIGTTAPESSLPAVAGGTRTLDDWRSTTSTTRSRRPPTGRRSGAP